MAISLRLAREGYGGGDPKAVLNMDADIVLAMLHYERFVGEYESAYVELNKEAS